jgi:NADPH-dependent curcumin reductase CurA
MPTADTWVIADEPARQPGAGEILVRVAFVSIDPAMRGWIEPRSSYVEPVAIGGVMRAEAVGEVIASAADGYRAGDNLVGPMGVQRFWTGTPASPWFFKAEPDQAPLERYLGALGLAGMTAYFGLTDVGRLEAGDTVVVSAAAGAVGALVGQMAKINGARVIGIAGGAVKCRYLVDDLGLDAAIDYKEGNIGRQLREHVPGGIDLLFDSVGGEILDAGLGLIARGARVVICGAISAYNDMRTLTGPRNYFNLVMQRASMTGFIVYDYAGRFAVARAAIGRYLDDGSLQPREHIEAGIDRFPEILPMLFRGENFGKLILDVRA